MSSTPQWYMAVGGQQVGPVTEEEIVNNIQSGSVDHQTLVFISGMDGWTPLKNVPRFQGHLPPLAPAAPPPVPASARRSDIIDYRIEGEDLQFVEVELDPGEACVAEAGAMMYMTAGIQMDTIFGDGSGQQKPADHGGAARRRQARAHRGEPLHDRLLRSRRGQGKGGLRRPLPGGILAMELPELGGELVCQKDSFLCAAKGVAISIAFQKKIGVGLFGGEGFIMQSLQGDGLCFVHAGGMLTERVLGAGETLRVDTGCIVALQPTRRLRRPVRGRREDRALRRRGALLRHPDRAGARLAAVAAPQPAGRTDLPGRAPDRWQPQGRRLDPRRRRWSRQHDRR